MKQLVIIAAVLAAVVGASHVSSRLWGGKPEKIEQAAELTYNAEMTVAQFGQANNLPNPMLKKVFALQSRQDLQKPISSFGLSQAQITRRIQGATAIQSEHAGKNWKKILPKFLFWFVWLTIAFLLLRAGRITKSNRPWLLAIPVVFFGIAFGSDPNPMGTVKDAIVLLAASKVIFPPRLIAFFVFLLMVFLANKLICSWGCQFGTLQDLIFRIAQSNSNKPALLRKRRIPFAVSNTVRIAFLLVFTAIAFLWSVDIIEHVDPFKTFKPAAITIAGGIFIALLVVLSLVVYRPWCHLFCPFGLVGWIVERFSLNRIRVDKQACTDCKACVKACPSTVMAAILDEKKNRPDCFSCGVCMQTCPTKAIHFGRPVKPQTADE